MSESNIANDSRETQNYQPLSQPLTKRKKYLRPVSYDYRKLVQENEDLNKSVQIERGFVETQEIQEEKIKNESPIINTLSRKLYGPKFPDLNAPKNDFEPNFGLDDQKMINNVQKILLKQGVNPEKVYKLMLDHRKHVYKLLLRYKTKQSQTEKILRQKLQNIEREKQTYVNLKSNEEMLTNLQNQIAMRIQDFQKNSDNGHNPISSHILSRSNIGNDKSINPFLGKNSSVNANYNDTFQKNYNDILIDTDIIENKKQRSYAPKLYKNFAMNYKFLD